MKKMIAYKNIDEYIKTFPTPVQKKLRELKRAIQKEAPEAKEKISYGIPTFYLNGNLVHFGAYPKHIGFYPGASGIEKFKDEISKYNYSKGTVQFSIEDPLPLELVKKIVQFRVRQNLKRKKKVKSLS